VTSKSMVKGPLALPRSTLIRWPQHGAVVADRLTFAIRAMTRWPGLLLALSIVGALIVLAAPPSKTDIVLMEDWTRQPLNSQGCPTRGPHTRRLVVPHRADVRHRETSDAAAHIFVVWLRWPPALRSRLIGYIWDANLPPGSVHKRQGRGARGSIRTTWSSSEALLGPIRFRRGER
jgi:hypothetical protein